MLITRLAALAEAVAELRDAQQHASQAAAALRAARCLHAATGTRPAAQSPARARMETAEGSLRSPFRLRTNQAGTDRPSTALAWPISGRRAGLSSHGHAAPPR